MRFPGPLLSLENFTFRYHKSATPTLSEVTLSVRISDQIGILGLNEAGKSTLIKLLVRDVSAPNMNITRHPRLKLAYYSQHAVENLRALAGSDDGVAALSLLTQEVSAEQMPEPELRGLLGSLGLPGRLASLVPLRKLSGGQLIRCELAILLRRRPHYLVLDEVTTHLDHETVMALREALRDWEGAVVLVSHNLWFVRGVVEG